MQTHIRIGKYQGRTTTGFAPSLKDLVHFDEGGIGSDRAGNSEVFFARLRLTNILSSDCLLRQVVAYLGTASHQPEPEARTQSGGLRRFGGS